MTGQVQNHHEGHIVPRVMVNHYGFSIRLPKFEQIFLNVTFLAYLVTETQLEIPRSKQHEFIGYFAQLLGYIVQFL